MRTLEAKERILVIEDSEDIAAFLVDTILQPSGYAPLLATTGQEGLRMALDVAPDLIFLDLNLSRMTGMEVLRGLRDTVPSIPIALMIFAGSEELAVEAFRLGVRSYVVKPLKPPEILKAIEDALRETRLRREKELLTEELMRANREVERRVRELTMLHEITQAITGSADLETLLSRVVEVGVFLTNADEGMLFLIDEETNELYLRAAKGVGDKRASLLLLPARDSLIGQVVKSGEPLRIASSDPRLDLTVKTGYMVNALLYVPLKIRGVTRGVLGVSNRISDRAFTRTDQSRLDLLADHTVIALEMARPHVAPRTSDSEVVGGAVAELAGYAHHSLKALAADTYTLKASAERGATMCADDTLNQLLRSMERNVEQMASVTEMLNGLVSPHSSEEDRERVQRRLQRLKVGRVS
ncbi:MAG: response regulator [Anaerolineae bacterium]|jgi:two-component system NtrC family sensor kinase